MFDAYRNPDGKTFNGIALMADLTGLSQSEIKWTADRLKQLMNVEGMSKEDALSVVKAEGAKKPWLSP